MKIHSDKHPAIYIQKKGDRAVTTQLTLDRHPVLRSDRHDKAFIKAIPMPDICTLSTEQTATKRDIILNIWWIKTGLISSTHLNMKNKMKRTKARHIHVFKKT